MRRTIAAALVLLACATAARAQSLTPDRYVVGVGGSATLTLSGPAGQQFAVIASRTNSGFSYAGTSLAVGPDVVILTTGFLDGSGNATVVVNPPFPQLDRWYLQAAFSPNGFASITASNSVVLLNQQEARMYMPAGGIVQSDGTLVFGTQGITATRTGVGVYRLDHAGLFSIPSVLPMITVGGNATVVSVAANANTTVVTLSTDASFFFTLQQIRR
jgi:hypothetical protein